MFTIDIDKRAFDTALSRAPEDVRKAVGDVLDVGLRDIAHGANRSHPSWKARSGTLERATKSKTDKRGLAGEVYIDDRVAPHGKFQHFGTRAHRVSPQDAKALHWVTGGQSHFSRGHVVSGIKGDPWVYDAVDRHKAELVSAIQKGYSRVMERLFEK